MYSIFSGYVYDSIFMKMGWIQNIVPYSLWTYADLYPSVIFRQNMYIDSRSNSDL